MSKKGKSEASALKNAIIQFPFILLVNMQTETVECINAASQLLQAMAMDFLKTSPLGQNTISVLMEFREQCGEAKSVTLAPANAV